MGFNNHGAEAMAGSLVRWRAAGQWPNHPVGINLGKSKITPLDQAADDYAQSFRCLWPHLDFFVVNVSSPNTPNLRQLQDKSALNDILATQDVNTQLASKLLSRDLPPQRPPSTSIDGGQGLKPVLVKIAPDLSLAAIDEILELVGPRNASKKEGHDLKFDAIVLARHGVTLRGLDIDTMLASYLIDATRSEHLLEDLALEHTSYKALTRRGRLRPRRESDVAGGRAGRGGGRLRRASAPTSSASSRRCSASCSRRTS